MKTKLEIRNSLEPIHQSKIINQKFPKPISPDKNPDDGAEVHFSEKF